MPPHCDSLDGPVVLAATRALEARDPLLVLPYVKASGEREVLEAYELAVAVRGAGGPAQALADRYFFETVVRVHRAGEGAPYTGLKPAGLGFGPVVPVAEAAIESGDPDPLVALLVEKVRHETLERFARMVELQRHTSGDVPAARAAVEAMLGLQVWAHGLYERAGQGAHGEPAGEEGHAEGHVH